MDRLPKMVLYTSLLAERSCYRSTVTKDVFNQRLLTLFKITEEYDNNRVTLRAHFTQAYRVLDTLPPFIINSCYYRSV